MHENATFPNQRDIYFYLELPLLDTGIGHELRDLRTVCVSVGVNPNRNCLSRYMLHNLKP